MPLRRALVLGTLLGYLMVAPAIAGADEGRVVLRVVQPRDADLLARTLGQTVDLEASVVAVPTPALEPDLSAQVERAISLLHREHADVVAWFAHEPGWISVFFAEPRDTRLVVTMRKVAVPSEEAIDRVAAEETVAQVVRAALQAIQQGQSVEDTGGHRVHEQALPQTTEAPTRVTAAWSGGVHYRAGIDGHSPRGQHGFGLQLALQRGALALRLLATWGLPASISDQRANLDVARHELVLATGGRWAVSDHFAFSAEARTGVTAFRRVTRLPAPGVDPTDAHMTPSPVLGCALGLLFAGPPEMGLRVGVDVIPRAPELVFQVDGQIEPGRQLLVLQPFVSFEVSLRTK